MTFKKLALVLALGSPVAFADSVQFMNCFDAANTGSSTLAFYKLGMNADGGLNLQAVVRAFDGSSQAYQGVGIRRGLMKFRATFGTDAGTTFGNEGIIDFSFTTKSIVENDGSKWFIGSTNFSNRVYECRLNVDRLKQQPATAPAQPEQPSQPVQQQPTQPTQPTQTQPEMPSQGTGASQQDKPVLN